MNIINNIKKIDEKQLLNILKEKKIDYINKDIYIFIYNFLDILHLLFLNDIKDFLSNKSNDDKNIVIVYQDNHKEYDFEHKYESLYREIFQLIRIRFSEIEYILWDK